MNIESLLQKAAQANPARRVILRKWTTLFPVFQALREKGFTGPAAVQWMIEQGALEAGDDKRAFCAFHQIAARRRKKDSVSQP